MGFLSPAGMRAGFKVMREIHRQSAYMSFASDSPIAEIDDDESFGDYLETARRARETAGDAQRASRHDIWAIRCPRARR